MLRRGAPLTFGASIPPFETDDPFSNDESNVLMLALLGAFTRASKVASHAALPGDQKSALLEIDSTLHLKRSLCVGILLTFKDFPDNQRFIFSRLLD